MTYTHKKIPYHASCVQWDGENTETVLALLNNDDTYAVRYGPSAIMVRFAKYIPDRKVIDTLSIGWWVVTGENGTVKCYPNDVFCIKYAPMTHKELCAKYLDMYESFAP